MKTKYNLADVEKYDICTPCSFDDVRGIITHCGIPLNKKFTYQYRIDGIDEITKLDFYGIHLQRAIQNVDDALHIMIEKDAEYFQFIQSAEDERKYIKFVRSHLLQAHALPTIRQMGRAGIKKNSFHEDYDDAAELSLIKHKRGNKATIATNMILYAMVIAFNMDLQFDFDMWSEDSLEISIADYLPNADQLISDDDLEEYYEIYKAQFDHPYVLKISKAKEEDDDDDDNEGTPKLISTFKTFKKRVQENGYQILSLPTVTQHNQYIII